MNIDEAIMHAKEVADKNRMDYKNCPANRKDIEHQTCEECAKEHEQLAEWLEKLKQYFSIGTVEECRTAVERRIKMRPVEIDNSGNICSCDRCPNCFEIVSGDYCENCGQAISSEDVED